MDLFEIVLFIFFFVTLFSFCRRFLNSKSSSSSSSSSIRVHTIRLIPGQELKTELLNYCHDHGIHAGFIVTCVGSLKKVHLRYAYSSDPNYHMAQWREGAVLEKEFEIVSLVGTISEKGTACHLHVTVSDCAGKTRGGHLLGDAIVRTTAEVVLGEAMDYNYILEHDESTGFPELVVERRSVGLFG